jgi:hypothetical protein
VRCMKYRLQRLVGVTAFTFEEVCTLITQVEAYLNSRPLNSFFHEPNDPIHLKPGNFLFGAPRTYSPEPNLSNLSVICLGGSTCNGSYNVFSTGGPQTIRLQHRGKWVSNLANLHPGTFVRVKDNNRPPQAWNMAVVEEVSTSRS